MKNILEYKGYFTKIEFNSDDMVLHGKIEGITDLITFESKDATKIEEEFHKAVDDYLEFCNDVGKEPQKAYKGTFNVRIKPELHKKLAIKAFKNGITLNQAVENAIAEYVKPSTHPFSELYFKVLFSATNENIYTETIKMWNKARNIYSFVFNQDHKIATEFPIYTLCEHSEDEVTTYVGF